MWGQCSGSHAQLSLGMEVSGCPPGKVSMVSDQPQPKMCPRGLSSPTPGHTPSLSRQRSHQQPQHSVMATEDPRASHMCCGQATRYGWAQAAVGRWLDLREEAARSPHWAQHQPSPHREHCPSLASQESGDRGGEGRGQERKEGVKGRKQKKVGEGRETRKREKEKERKEGKEGGRDSKATLLFPSSS